MGWKRELILGSIFIGLVTSYFCLPEKKPPQKVPTIERNVSQVQQVEYRTRLPHRSLMDLARNNNAFERTEIENQIGHLTQLQNVLDNEDKSLFEEDGYHENYAEAALALYEYCQNIGSNEIFQRNQEVRDKFRELFYRVPVYAGLLRTKIRFSEEKEIFSFNNEEELHEGAVDTLCSGSGCEDLDLEDTLNLVCGSALASSACRPYDKQALEEWTFGQLIISRSWEDFRDAVKDCYIPDRGAVVAALSSHLEHSTVLLQRLEAIVDKPQMPEEVIDTVTPPSQYPIFPFLHH